MAITFSGNNLESYSFTSVDQLVGLRSFKDNDLIITFKTTNLNDTILKSLTISSSSLNTDIITMLVNCENDTNGYSAAITPINTLISVLNAFGFNVFYDDKPIKLNQNTINYLKNVNAIGFEYLNITSEGIIIYLNDMKRPTYASDLIGFKDCDFSKLESFKVYNISMLINNLVTSEDAAK